MCSFEANQWRRQTIGMCPKTTFRSTKDRIDDGGPIRLEDCNFMLKYDCVTIAYSIQYNNML